MACTCSIHDGFARSTDGGTYSVRERLKDILRQYELRERHFECVIRSKELEVLLSRARAAEQKQLAEGEKLRAEKLEEEARVTCLFPTL
jgi:Myosin-like coiled-coil protein